MYIIPFFRNFLKRIAPTFLGECQVFIEGEGTESEAATSCGKNPQFDEPEVESVFTVRQPQERVNREMGASILKLLR